MTRQTIFANIKYMKDTLEKQKTLYGSSLKDWPQEYKGDYYALNYPFDFDSLNSNDFEYMIEQWFEFEDGNKKYVKIQIQNNPKLLKLLNNGNMDFLSGLCDNRKEYLTNASSNYPNYHYISEEKDYGHVICIMDLGLIFY